MNLDFFTKSFLHLANAVIALVAGLIGSYLQAFESSGVSQSWPESRFMYIEAIAGLSILLALIWLVPKVMGWVHYLTDFVLLLLWVVSYGLLVDFTKQFNCGSIWAFNEITKPGTCQRWMAAVAFSFLSICFWFISALVVGL